MAKIATAISTSIKVKPDSCRGTAIELSTAGRHRSSPSPRDARTGRGLGRGVSDLCRQPSSPRPSPPWVGGEGDDGLSRQRPDSATMEAKLASTHRPKHLHGEIFICIDDAVKQARQFRTTWQSELVRYLIHGVLHLVGYDDLTLAGRCVMKREENRLLRMLSRRFSFRHLANPRPSPARKSQIVVPLFP